MDSQTVSVKYTKWEIKVGAGFIKKVISKKLERVGAIIWKS